ncbi:MAG TPA: DNA starvation/stationary phase protection protein [Pyrinomonadaceae bacterium]|jgi:starvation-inducible DNA-binding protein
MKDQNTKATATSLAETNGEFGSGQFRHDQPKLGQRARELQTFGEVMKRLRIGLRDEIRSHSVAELSQILADSMMLRDLYKKHHWQVSGITFRELHLLFDKHYEQQVALIDEIAERIQILGGVAVAAPQDVAEMTRILRPLKGREEVPVQLSRLLEAHEVILIAARDSAARAAERGDDGTNDLLVGSVIRTHEQQVWFLSEHLINVPLTEAD